MKKLLTLGLAFGLVASLVQAAGPIPNYQWNFNLTNSAAGTNLVNSARPGGNIQGGAAPTQEAILEMVNSANVSANLLGLPGSGVGTNTLDRGALLNGTMGGSGPLIRTPDNNRSITNLGLLTNFTITAWIKADSALSGFPRIFMIGSQGQDAGGLNNISFLLFTGESLQLKIHGLGANGISSPAGFLSAGLNDWLFVAVTYDAVIDPSLDVTNYNVYFYSGDRFNTLAAGTGARYGTPNGAGTTINSIAPASTTGPGFVNYAGTNFLNGDSTFGVTNVFAYIGNRDNRGRAFNGRYDDVRFYANKVLTQAELDQVRQDPGLPLPQRLTFTAPPQNTTVAQGVGASFTVTTTPAPNTTYQWYRMNPGSSVSNAVAGATNQTLEIPGVTVASDNGAKYGVRVFSTDPFAGYNGVGTNSSFALLTVVSPAAAVATPGMLKFDYFANTGNGDSVGGFLGAPTSNYANNTPNLTKYLTTFDTREVFPDDSHLNYFVKVSGSIIPTETTNYVFFIRAGDQAELYLSTDGGVSSNLICADFVTGQQGFTGPESVVSVAGGRFSTPQALTAGTAYPITAFLKSSAGADVLQVAWRKDSGSQDLPSSDEDIADRLKPIPSSVLSTPAVPSGTVSIALQPTPVSPSVVAHSKVMLTAGVSSSLSISNAATLNGPVVVQWQKNGVNIDGATGTNYTTPYLNVADNGATFRVIASIPGASATSSVATVSVSADSVAPTVVSAASDDTMRTVTVKFSEPVGAATALNPANYSIAGLAVSGVKWAADTNLVNSPTFDAVKLTTALQTDATSYTVTVTGVKDTANNTIAGSNTAAFQSYKLATGFAKFEYFETQTYTSIAGLDVNGVNNFSPKFINNDPDTVVFPTTAEMSPDGSSNIRSGFGGTFFNFPTVYATRLSTVFVAPATTNYVFYTAGNDSLLLWLSTDANPTNKHVIAWQGAGTSKRNWPANVNASTATFPTNLVDGVSVTATNNLTGTPATPWPVADVNGYAVISLTAGQRYYLELDHIENLGFDSFDAVTYVTAPDNASVVAPGNGTAPALTGSVIGWYFPASPITSFTQVGSNVNIAWQNGFSSLNRGALGYPGLGFITDSVPVPYLQQASIVTGPYANLTNNSPATLPATGPAGFFRVGQ